ncbi:MAG: DUF4260 domain-containing protein [Bacteroidetes bacterium]|nr:DUF4260 domain-containing protein [Bacteroidota bacterium]MBI3483393.1 DUF4260 domain-containing protein [Bacteroidota bacterium]
MNLLLKLEDASKFVAAYVLSQYFGNAWWLFFAWLLAPDLSMIGYIINTKVGAILYNLAHHQGLAIVVFAIGFYLRIPALTFAGIVLFGHSALDRLLGYGLKYPDDFKHTHLGWIGKK